MKSQLELTLFGVGTQLGNKPDFHYSEKFSLAAIIIIRDYVDNIWINQVDTMRHAIEMYIRYFHGKERESEPLEEN